MKKSLPLLVILSSVLSLPVQAAENSKEFFFEIGASFGGDEVAINNNGGLGGDNYNAGGGAVLGFGAKLPLAGRIYGQGLAAYRYQDGDGSNSGVVLEAAVLYKFNNAISAGLGLHADFNSETETATGQTIEFEDATGPMAIAHWQFDDKLAIGAKYIAMDYETSNAVEYDGGQAAVYVHYSF